MAPLTLGHELARKGIHAATGLVTVPLLAWPRRARAALAAAVAVALTIELARRRSPRIAARFERVFGPLLRARERTALTGATTLALADWAAAVLFPPRIAAAAQLYAAWGDAAAALVGRRFGRFRLGSGKSLEGAAAAFAVDWIVGRVLLRLPPPAALAGALAASLAELLPGPGDDNLRVALAGGAVLALAERRARR